MKLDLGSRARATFVSCGHFDDAVADGLHGAAGHGQTHASAVNPGLGNHIGFLDFERRRRAQRGKPFAGGLGVIVGGGHADGVHARGIDSVAALEVSHLLFQEIGGDAGQVGRFRMAMAGIKMAGGAGEPFIGGAAANDLRRTLGHVWVPIRRIAQIVDLFQGI